MCKHLAVASLVLVTVVAGGRAGANVARADDASGRAEVPAVTAEPVSAPSEPVAAEPADKLSVRTETSLGRLGTVFIPTTARALVGLGVKPVSKAVAVDHATGTFSFTRKPPAEVVLGLLTVPTKGKLAGDDPKAQRIVPDIDRKPVWFVVYQDIETPLYGPPDLTAEGPQPVKYQEGGLWIAVDAATGDVIGGETVDY